MIRVRVCIGKVDDGCILTLYGPTSKQVVATEFSVLVGMLFDMFMRDKKNMI